ncbi:hypothetical protein LWI28_001341 [Acer negundo]|uniref:Uncharacterized protein n=1 Tax=Acer negundo TaxID=4023 RepID=A0AAD5NTH0_ACENE|nr:hypothetical protein LWI28_001341 [Acer negundo]
MNWMMANSRVVAAVADEIERDQFSGDDLGLGEKENLVTCHYLMHERHSLGSPLLPFVEDIDGIARLPTRMDNLKGLSDLDNDSASSSSTSNGFLTLSSPSDVALALLALKFESGGFSFIAAVVPSLD